MPNHLNHARNCRAMHPLAGLIPAAHGRRLFLVFPLAFRRPRDLRQSEGAGGPKFLGASQRAFTDPVQQIGLRGFQRDEPAEHVQQVNQIGRVFGQPMARLDRVKRRRRATVTNDRSGAVAATIAEPMPKHLPETS
jgi:hypothetical protein